MKISADLINNLLIYHSKVLDEKSSILSHIYIEAKDNKLTLQSSDKARVLTSFVDFPCEREEKFCIQYLTLIKLLDRTEGELEFISDDNDRITIKGKGFRTKIPCTFPENFPFREYSLNTKLGEIQGEILTGAISRISPYIGDHWNFLVIKVISGKGEIVGAGSDGTQLGIYKFETELGDIDFNIHKDDLPVIYNLVNKKELISIYKDGGKIAFKFSNKVLECREVTGKLPNYEVIYNDTSEILNKIVIPSSINITKHLYINEDSKVLPITLSFTKDKITTYSKDAQGEEVEQYYDIDYDEEDFSIIIRSNYLQTFLTKIKSEVFYLIRTVANQHTMIVLQEDGVDYTKICGLQAGI